ncbi:oxidoreductase [Agromyces protaetiae]|uniref:Oxidoreductase n=1 Tax=Agromyces protaetiae TaxID=2509455 RepID=A0A4P6FF38_9MICO|nr:Gfo/Idh/MocA family oxidoreductase [Agromyces protaetiae]QAY74940.1 oxidoreductase [Agromyces protaetiae]
MARRVGVIGFGLAGRVFHGPLIAAEAGLELAAIVTGDAERAADARRRHPKAEIVSDVSELFSRDDLDLVVVAAPTPRHLELAERSIEAGFATVVDKPLAVRAADAERLVASAEERGVPLTVFQNRRWDGDFLTVKKLIDDGALGDVWRFESRFEWISSRPRPEWKSGTPGAEGGGVAYDLGAHLIDQAIRLFGPVADVYGELDVRREGGVNDDDAFIALTHASGVRSHLAMASLVAQRGFRFRVLGSASAYTKWGLDPQEAQLAGGLSPLDAAYGVTDEGGDGLLGRDGETSVVPTERGGYREFYRRVAAALEGDGLMPVDPRDAIEPIRIIEALQARA